MRLLSGFILIICLVVGVIASGFADLEVEKSDSQGLYDVTWRNCTFTQALKDLHAQFDIHSFAQIIDNERIPSTSEMKGQLMSLVAIIMGNIFGRDNVSIGTTPVFRPTQPQGISTPVGERDMIASQLIASFTSKQIKIHRSEGMLPFAELSEKQQQQVSYLVRTFTQHTQFPEPELSKRLQESAVIMTIVPMINFDCDYIDRQGRPAKMSSGFYCDRDISQEFWMGKAAGQLEAFHLKTAAMTNPGADVPGDAEVHSLDGTYTLSDLLRKVDSTGSIRVAGDLNKMRFEAHCDFTSASIARACASATGMNWHRGKDGWSLAVDGVLEMVDALDPSADDQECIREYERQIPAIQKIAYQGNMVLAIDKVWQSVSLGQMLQGNSVRWNTLTPDQQAYLKVGAEMYNKTPGLPDMAPYLPKMKLTWHPNMKLYIVTKDDALYVEWLRFQPMFAPEGEKQFLSGKSSAGDSAGSKSDTALIFDFKKGDSDTLSGAGPVCGGFQLLAKLDKSTVVSGEKVILKLILQNVSTTNRLFKSSNPRTEFKLMITDDHGQGVPGNANLYGGAIEGSLLTQIEPGDQVLEGYRINSVFDDDIRNPGVYNITARTNAVFDTNGAPLPVVTSNTITLTVVKDPKVSGSENK